MWAVQGESLGPAPVVARFRGSKPCIFKRRAEEWAFEWLAGNGIEVTHLVPDVPADFDESEVLSTWATPETIVPADVCQFAWADVLEKLHGTKCWTWEMCLNELTLVKSAGFPWRTTKEAVLREFERRGVDFLSFVKEHERKLCPVYFSFPKEELREIVDGTPKDVHQISGGEMAVHVVQYRYCGDLFSQLIRLGAFQTTWWSPGLSMFHGGWDRVARRHMGHPSGEERIFICIDFKKNNQTFGLDMLSKINTYFRKPLWDQPESLVDAEIVWSYDGEKLLALRDGRVVDFSHTLASGSGNTTKLNTLQCRAKAVWLLLTIAHMSRDRYYNFGPIMDVYGDNVFLSVRRRFEQLFTVEAIQACARVRGMSLTCSVSRTIEGAEFLSHRFVLRRGQYVSFPAEPRKAFVSLAYAVSDDPEVCLSRYVAQMIRLAPDDRWFQKVKQMAEVFVDRMPGSSVKAPHMWSLIQKPATYYLSVHTLSLERFSERKEPSPLKEAGVVEALSQSTSLIFLSDDEVQSSKATCTGEPSQH